MASGFFNPQAVVAYGTNFLYVADSGNQVIKSVTITSGAPLVALAAGTGTQGDTNLATPQLASSVDLNYPSGLAVNSSGDLYITDSQNSRILKLSSGNLILVAGSPTGAPGYTGDGGPATEAHLNFPNAIAFDGAGNLYIADGLNFVIRMVNTSGIISTIAGNGVNGDSGTEGRRYPPKSDNLTGSRWMLRATCMYLNSTALFAKSIRVETSVP